MSEPSSTRPKSKAAAAEESRVHGGSILDQYQKLYGSGQMSLSRNYSDKFPFLEHALKDDVMGKTVLDFGCGPGRLSLMLARSAASVKGVDFSSHGVDMAKSLAEISETHNASFSVGGLDFGEWSERSYDVIVVAGTLEHVADPRSALAVWKDHLVPGGLLCVQTPNFGNFRGDVYNTLQELLGLPMSLTDVWQFSHVDFEHWAQELGLDLRRVAGSHYSLGLLDRAREDLVQRIPAAARDRGLGEGWDFDRLESWLGTRARENELLVRHLEEAGILRTVPAAAPLTAIRPDGMDEKTWSAIHLYLTYDGWRERLYTDTPPFNFFGASAAYFLDL